MTGQSSCIGAEVGFYVDTDSSPNQLACPEGSSTTQVGSTSPNDCLIDTDGDNVPDSVDEDDDGDGIVDSLDSFPLDDSEQIDTDEDGIGDNEDLDDDNDSISDADELEDGTDPLDADSDQDGHDDSADEFPLDPSKWEEDSLPGFSAAMTLCVILIVPMARFGRQRN